MKKKIIAMLAAMMCLASSSLSYSSVAIAANSLNSNDIAEVKITSSDLKECNLVTESKNDGCWINFDLVSGAFAMSGNNHQSFSIIGSFERKDNDLYLYPENGSAEFYILHREEDHFVSQSDEIGVQLKAGLVFYADNDAFWEILLDWTLSGNEPSNTGETAEQNTSFIMGDVNDDDTFEDTECAMTVTVSEINGETLLVKSSDGKGELLTLSTKYLDSSIQPKVGMKLEVVYTGGILQTYPCQFGNVKKVSVVSDNTTLMGDVNADGEFGIADVILLQKWLLAVPDTHLANWKAADYCEDNKLDVFDLTLMKRALLEGINSPDEPPATEIAPLEFNSTDDVVKAISANDLSDYTSSSKEAYEKMFERFRADGFIYNVKANDHVAFTENSKIKLHPDHTLEDMCIKYSVMYQGKKYNVSFRNADMDVIAETDGITEYVRKRWDSNADHEIMIGDTIYTVSNASDGSQIAAMAFIDEKHYIQVIGYESATENDLKDLLSVLEYEKLDITANTGTDPNTPVTAQPIEYKNVETAIEAINNNDINAYPEQYYNDYCKMFERFQNDGFIYQVTDNELIKTNEDRGTTLFPSASYEDVGVGYFVTFKGNNYHILFYSADTDVLAETDGIAAYLKKRMGRSSDKVIAVNDKNVSLLFHENGQCYANAFVDENHYFDVIGDVSEEEMTEFLNAFTYEKTVF